MLNFFCRNVKYLISIVKLKFIEVIYEFWGFLCAQPGLPLGPAGGSLGLRESIQAVLFCATLGREGRGLYFRTWLKAIRSFSPQAFSPQPTRSKTSLIAPGAESQAPQTEPPPLPHTSEGCFYGKC